MDGAPVAVVNPVALSRGVAEEAPKLGVAAGLCERGALPVGGSVATPLPLGAAVVVPLSLVAPLADTAAADTTAADTTAADTAADTTAAYKTAAERRQIKFYLSL
jgi:hypothetical protein